MSVAKEMKNPILSGGGGGGDLERTQTFTRPSEFRRNDSEAGFRRNSTFSRMYTFDGQGKPEHVLNRTLSNMAYLDPMNVLTRTMSSVGQTFDPDGEMTKNLLSNINKAAKGGHEGDVPEPPAFARKIEFWKMMLLNSLVAMLMGVVGACFMNVADEVPKHYTTCKYEDKPSCGDWYTGEKYWMLITGGAGMVVGLLRWGFAYPDDLPGLFKEISDYHVHWEWSPLTVALSAVSLGGGASLGPEAALTNLGGGVGTFMAEFIADFEDPEDDKLMVLSGMASALGALFPTPVLSALMIVELGAPPKSYMEAVTTMSISACISFAVYYEMVGETALDYLSPGIAVFSEKWEYDGGYNDHQFFSAVAIGCVSAALCLYVTINIGVTKQIFARIRMRLENKPFLKEVVPPLLGGIAIGAINWALPGTVGNGHLTTPWVLKYGPNEEISQKLLICCGFARAFLLGISMNCGFIGGFVFPMLSMGAIAGVVCSLQYPGLPVAMSVGCFMFALPCAIVPLPFTFTALCCFLFYFGLYETVPVFVSILTSYLLLCGSGIFQRLRAGKKEDGDDNSDGQKDGDSKAANNAATARKRAEEDERKREREEAEQYAVNQYATKTNRVGTTEMEK